MSRRSSRIGFEVATIGRGTSRLQPRESRGVCRLSTVGFTSMEFESRMITPTSTNETAGESPEAEGTISVLLRLAAAARLYRSGDGGLHVQVPVAGRYETYGLKSAGFRDWLIDGYFAERHEPASPAAIQRVVSVLEARARFDGATPSVFVRRRDTERLGLFPGPGRWHWKGGQDLRGRVGAGRSAGNSVPASGRDVTASGARAGGSIELLRPYVNVTDEGFRLVVAWLTAALRPVGPYPILSLHGEQGSAKSTLARILRLLVDPQACPLLVEPASTRDLMVTAVNGWLLAYDNISAIPNWLSDSLCRLVYGGGFSGRALFSNQERVTVQAQRPVILNGIEDFVRKSDLMDRTVILHLAAITRNRRARRMNSGAHFEAEHPLILGAVLDAVAGGMRRAAARQIASIAADGRLCQMGRSRWPRGRLGARSIPVCIRGQQAGSDRDVA